MVIVFLVFDFRAVKLNTRVEINARGALCLDVNRLFMLTWLVFVFWLLINAAKASNQIYCIIDNYLSEQPLFTDDGSWKKGQWPISFMALMTTYRDNKTRNYCRAVF